VFSWKRHMRLPHIVTYFELVVALPFLGKKTEYDESTARKLLNMAAGAYVVFRAFPAHEEYVLLSVSKKACDDFGNNCEGYIAVSNVTKEIVIVFRGTRTKGQLFLQGLNSILPRLKFFDMGKDYEIVFTGHSLGGALATLAAARTAKQGLRANEKITVYTYGEPRVGDALFATNYDSMIKDSYRVVFRRDIVPHLPACAKNKSWLGDSETSRPCDVNAVNEPYHQGTEIWYPDSMEPGSHYIECTGDPRGEDFT
ncbi:Triacylglycerol lipase, partial [Trichostrongylus colubriformis]